MNVCKARVQMYCLRTGLSAISPLSHPHILTPSHIPHSHIHYPHIHVYSTSRILTLSHPHLSPSPRTLVASKSGSSWAVSESQWRSPVRSQHEVFQRRKARTILFTSRGGHVSPGSSLSISPNLPRTGHHRNVPNLTHQLTLR